MNTMNKIPKMIINPEWKKQQEEIHKERFAKVQAAIGDVIKNPEQLKKISRATYTKKHQRVLSSVRYIRKAEQRLRQLKSTENPSKSRIGQIEAHLKRRLDFVQKLGFEVKAS